MKRIFTRRDKALKWISENTTRSRSYQLQTSSRLVSKIRITRFPREYSYLRFVKGRKRRKRIHVSYYVETRQKIRRRVKIYVVVPVLKPPPTDFYPLRDYIQSIADKYEIRSSEIEYPKEYLHYFHPKSNFFSWVKRYPPYRHDEEVEYVKVEIWFLIWHREKERFFIWSFSRAKGLEKGVSWLRVFQIKDELSDLVEEKISEWTNGYGEFRGVIGWTVYPNKLWYNKSQQSRKHWVVKKFRHKRKSRVKRRYRRR